MKKFLHNTILVALIFLSFNANAKTKLSISTTMPTAMKVIIDGHKFYSQDNSISIKNLRPGYHNIAVYYIKTGREWNNYYNNGNNNYWKKAVNRQVLVKNDYVYDITINRFGRAFYDQDYYYNNGRHYGWKEGKENNEEYDDYDEMDNSFNSNFDFERDGVDEDYNDWDYFKKQPNKSDEKFNNNNDYGNYKTYNQPMTNQMFNGLKETIQQTNFETSKLQVAKQSIDKYSINTYQVKEIMSLLNMEIDKLEFAKYAYDKTRDANNYLTVLNSLSMQSSKDELLKVIKQ